MPTAGHVLDDPRNLPPEKHLAGVIQHPSGSVKFVRRKHVVLARWRSVLGGERAELNLDLLHERLIGTNSLHKRVWIVRLGFNVDTNGDLEPGQLITLRSSAGATKTIPQSSFAHFSRSFGSATGESS
jgi:hypothetical protein